MEDDNRFTGYVLPLEITAVMPAETTIEVLGQVIADAVTGADRPLVAEVAFLRARHRPAPARQIAKFVIIVHLPDGEGDVDEVTTSIHRAIQAAAAAVAPGHISTLPATGAEWEQARSQTRHYFRTSPPHRSSR